MPNPKYQIKNFTKDNVYWLNDMLLVNVGGNNIITGGFYSALSGATSSSISNVTDMSEILLTSNRYKHLVSIDDGKIILTKISSLGTNYGLIHTSIASGTNVMVTTSNNILYTTNRYLGVGYYFKATGGTETTITDTDVNFTTWGISNAAGHNKVYDLTLSQEFTITSKTDTELTVTAVAGKVPAQHDLCFVFNDEAFELTTSATAQDLHFSGQPAPADWIRQIIKLDDRYFIANGNYLAMLSADETTITDDYQQLPKGVQITCMCTNNDRILIGGEGNTGAGRLMVYDGFSSYFKSIINTDSIPVSISAYQNGWVVVFKDGEIRYTDGVSWKVLSTIPDTEISKGGMYPYNNSSVILNNRIIMSCQNISSNIPLRRLSGIHIYDIEKNMWSFTRPVDSLGYVGGLSNAAPKCLYKTDILSTGSPRIYYGKNESIGIVSAGSGATKKEIFFSIQLPKKSNLRGIELNLGTSYNEDFGTIVGSLEEEYATITVSSTDGRYGLTGYNMADSTSTTTNIVPGSPTYRGIAFNGQEIKVLMNSTSGDVNGDEYTFITTVTDSGEATEHWTVEALTSNFANDQDVIMYGFRKGEQKNIYYNDINSNTTFKIDDFYGDKLYLHIRINGYMDLYGVNLY